MIRHRDIDAMRQRRPNQFGIDECRNSANFGDAEPGSDVIRPARHEQANRIAGLDAHRQRPACVTVYPLGQGLIAEGLGVRQQTGVGELQRNIADRPADIARDPRLVESYLGLGGNEY